MALFPMMSGLAWPNVVNPPHFGLGMRRRRRETEDSYGDVVAPEVPMVGANGLLGQFDPNAQYPAVEPEEQMDPRYSIQPGTDQGCGSYQASAADFGEKQPQQGGLMSRLGGLFGGGPQNINLALLQAGLGTMAAGGWQKMPVTLGQAIGQGSYPSVQTQIEQNKWDEQRGMREEELNIRRLSGQAYADQIKGQEEERKAKSKLLEKRGALFNEYQSKLAAGDQEGAMNALRNLVAIDDPGELAKHELARQKAPTTVVVGAGGKRRQRMAFNPETGEFDKPVGQPYESGSLVDVNLAGEKAETVGEANRRVDVATKVFETSESADKDLATVQVIRGIGAKTGRMAPVEETAGAWAQALGLSPETFNNAAKLQAFEAIAEERIFSKQAELKGQTSDRDMESARKTFARIKNTPAANDFMLDNLEAQSIWKKEKGKFFRDWYEEKDTYKGAEGAWEEQAPSIFDMPSMQKWRSSDSPSNTTPKVQSDSDYQKLKPGQIYIGPDGKQRRKM
jgi:hypothetical protein